MPPCNAKLVGKEASPPYNATMNLFRKLENWRVLSAVRKNPIAFSQWKIVRKLHCLQHLTSVEKARLRILTSVLLHQKNLIGVQGLILNNEMKIIIAAQACVPILKLGLNYYSGFIQISVYPTAFWVEHEIIDASGVLHHEKQLLSGQSWSHGPVILSWDDIEKDMLQIDKGHNVVIHEFVHKIDMLNQGANGVPPVHQAIDRKEWGKVFRYAYQKTSERLNMHHKTHINAYSTTSPAEFFAVVSEYFFTSPEYLLKHYKKVYKELKRFYKQDPAHNTASHR